MIPVIFSVQTMVSYLCSVGISKAFRFNKRPRNFVIAMGVFGNSNSLPISLVVALSQTLKGLHWDKIPGDNDDEVAARGILYLLIFQQLGQLVRWSWGYHVLLAPPEKFEEEDAHDNDHIEQGRGRYRDDQSEQDLLGSFDDAERFGEREETMLGSSEGGTPPAGHASSARKKGGSSTNGESDFESGEETPVTHHQYQASVSSIKSSGRKGGANARNEQASIAAPTNGRALAQSGMEGDITSFPRIGSMEAPQSTRQSELQKPRRWLAHATRSVRHASTSASQRVSTAMSDLFRGLPSPVQHLLSMLSRGTTRFLRGLWSFMNPPLWAMLAAIVVASIPSLQRLFFTEGTFIQNSVTRAVSQSGGVAIPLILVVLGANLARNTLPDDAHRSIETEKVETRLLIASIVSRMLLPFLIMAPMIALAAKYVPISILDDPIFVIVCFLLTGAPSALQLAQICQINGVYEGVMSRLLFQSYVIWILPSTLILVMSALEVVEWAKDL